MSTTTNPINCHYITLLNLFKMSLLRINLLVNSLPKRTAVILCRSFADKIEDIGTHTGQKWDSNDYRMVRFINSPKQVNTQWAAKLIADVPPKEVSERIVWCDGGSGPEGHPRVYINLDKPGEHSCGYCGLRFIKKSHH